MTRQISELISRNLSDKSTAFSVSRLNGGISSEIYKIDSGDPDLGAESRVLTVLRDPDTWWKLDHERRIRDLVGNNRNVLIPDLLKTGVDELGGQTVAFFISEFIEGSNVDQFLENNLKAGGEIGNLQGFVRDLGFRLASIHNFNLDLFGALVLPGRQHVDWRSYIVGLIDEEDKRIRSLDPSLRIGQITAGQIQRLLPGIEKIVGGLERFLTVETPQLSHGDARFGNIMAKKEQDGRWCVTSFVDLEAVFGADPEIDIAYMENWLFFSSYSCEFIKQKASFIDGYSRVRQISDRYPYKRLVYHTLRSISYLGTVFRMDVNEFIKANDKHTGYVAGHFEIINSLAKGNSLQDIDIPSLV